MATSLLVVALPAQAASPLSWTSPENVNPVNNGFFNGMSCPTPHLCVGADGAGNVVTSTNPTRPASWFSTPVSTTNGSLGAVSCASENLCVEVDQSGDVAVSTDPASGTWATPFHLEDHSLYGVSCVVDAPFLCVISDSFSQVFTSTNPGGGAGTWTATAVNSDAAPTAVTCPTPTLCVLVDFAGNVITSTDPTGGATKWSAAANVDGTNRMLGISCPTTTLCVASDTVGNVLTSTNPTGGATAWAAPVATGLDQLSDVSCVGNLCVISSYADTGEVAESTAPTGGSWTVTKIDGLNETAHVSCPSVLLCVVGDDPANPADGGNVIIGHGHDFGRPVSTITTPVNGSSHVQGTLTEIDGTALDPVVSGQVQSGISRVQVAIREKRRDGTCRWLKGAKFVPASCKAPKWNTATGTESWQFALPVVLPTSTGKIRSYRVLSRAIDLAGNKEIAFEAGRNKNSFSVT